jgi:histidine ammonia-lyase
MISIDGSPLSLEDVCAVADGAQILVKPDAWERMRASRAVIEQIVEGGRSVYGVNTGFGKLSEVAIPRDKLSELQVNLVRSHACGVGEPLERKETRAMMLLRANVLAGGFSGARPVVLEHLVAMLNSGIHPVIPSRGSVGASGDLAPLAHLALAAIGEGQAEFGGQVFAGAEALFRAGLAPLKLEAKEGLALLNGTQAMAAVGGLALARGLWVLEAATKAAAISLDALLGTPDAFDERIHDARRHAGQRKVACVLREHLRGSAIRESHRTGDSRVQDAYSLRCVPQVHGAILDVLEHCRGVIELETGAATDNPLVFAESGDVISGGNFHGAPLSYALDYAAIALTDLASMSERRIDRLVNPDSNEGLPPFLARKAGLESGYMIAHVTAAALASEMKGLAHPASVDSVPTSGGKEDHVSMGMAGALKLSAIIDLAARVIAIELMAASEGLEHRRPLRSSPGIEADYDRVRKVVPPLLADRSLSSEIEAVKNLVLDGEFRWPNSGKSS